MAVAEDAPVSAPASANAPCRDSASALCVTSPRLSRSCSADRCTAAAGLLSSWATPAASVPRVASFSLCRSMTVCSR